jgi:hypothetical protein
MTVVKVTRLFASVAAIRSSLQDLMLGIEALSGYIVCLVSELCLLFPLWAVSTASSGRRPVEARDVCTPRHADVFSSHQFEVELGTWR